MANRVQSREADFSFHSNLIEYDSADIFYFDLEPYGIQFGSYHQKENCQ